MKTTIQLAFDDQIQKHVVFYTTDRIDFDFETGQQLEPIMCDYHTLEEIANETDAQKALVYYTAKAKCESCEGRGTIYWGDSAYGCAHGLSMEQRYFNGKQH